MADTCLNCGDSETARYDLLLRSNGPTEVALCDECHAALEEEFIWRD